MLVTEIIEREVNDTYQVELTDEEVEHLRRVLDDFATFPDIMCADLYAELRDEVSRTMDVTYPEACAIAGCLESEDDLGDLHRKFSLEHPSRGDPCWYS